MDDLLWPHFSPLWQDLGAVSSTDILVAGGYGLFLKQRWLSEESSSRTVVPIQNWRDATPRVTKDVDLVLERLPIVIRKLIRRVTSQLK